MLNVPTPRRRLVVAAALLFCCSLGVSTASLVRNVQLGFLRGLSDRWLPLGLDLAAHGVYGVGGEPTVFKPPGYPMLLASVFKVCLGTPPGDPAGTSFGGDLELAGLWVPYRSDYVRSAVRAVYWCNALLLAASTVAMFLWLAGLMSKGLAFGASLVYGTNPYCVALVGALHYSVVHLAVVVAGCLALHVALGSRKRPVGAMFGCGAVWGAATLVRPVTLLLPAFVGVAAALGWRASGRRRVAGAVAFGLGLLVVVAPYSVRNYLLSGRAVPVSLQVWMNVWGAASQVVPAQPNRYRWKALRPRLMRVLRDVPDRPLRTDPNSVSDNLKLDAFFRRKAIEKLRQQPAVYLRNAWNGFVSFNAEINWIVVGLYRYHQEPDAKSRDWYWPGTAQEFEGHGAGRAFGRYADVLGVLALVGAAAAIKRRDRSLLVAASVYLCFAVSHAAIWLDLMYYYVKVPFLLVFAFSAMDAARRWGAVSLGGARVVSVGDAAGVVVAAWSLALTGIVVFGGP